MTFSVLLTFTDFQLIYAITRGGPINATQLMATLSFQRAITGGNLGEGAAIADAMVPFLLGGHPVQLFRPAASKMAARLAGLTMASPATDNSRAWTIWRRCRGGVVTLYLPLAVFLFVLLFPFYWMTTTTFKPDDELYDYARFNPFWVAHPTLEHIKKLFFETSYPSWLINTMLVSVAATAISLFCSVCAAYAIERLRFSRRALCRARDLPRLSRAAQHPVHSARRDHLQARPVRQRLGAGPDLSDLPRAVLHLAADGLLRTIPYELEECALIDGATRLQILWKITLPLAIPGLISAGIFAFTLSWNEFIYALTFISSSENKTVPVGAITELVEGDVYHWGSLMAAALFGSLPVVILYSFFVEYYVSSLTGAVKE